MAEVLPREKPCCDLCRGAVARPRVYKGGTLLVFLAAKIKLKNDKDCRGP